MACIETPEDILTVAIQLGRQVVSLCTTAEGETFQIAYEKKWTKDGPVNGQGAGFVNYWIQHGKLLRQTKDRRGGEGESSYQGVNEGRDVAVLFVADIVNGLLQHIAHTLAKRRGA